MPKKKIALFGGTFDPIHLGHTAVAAASAEQTGAESVIFVPAKCSPQKISPPQVSDSDRLAMIDLAIAGNRIFQVSDYELKKAAPSYTLDTVKFFRGEYGSNVSIYWLAGADCMGELLHWYKIAELIESCELAIMYRAGFDVPDFSGFEPVLGRGRVDKLRQNVIKTPLVNVSSTEIRNRLAAGLSVADMVNPAVDEYIRSHRLYQSGQE